MIRLKSLLFEKRNKSALQVLFVGDSQTLASNSYAKRLLNTRDIDGKIVAKPNADLSEIFTMLQENMSDRYDVVSILAGDIDSRNEKYETSIEQLKQIYLFVKKFDCILVAIATPTKQYTKDPSEYPSADEISKWIKKQTISDITINLSCLDNLDFRKDGVLLDSDAQQGITELWLTNVLNKVSKDDTVTDTDSDLVLDKSTIKQLQLDLMSLGYFVGPEKDNGKFNEYTKSALTKFQRDNGIDVTGKFDIGTKNSLTTTLDSTTKDDEWKLINLIPTKNLRQKVAGDTATADDIIDFFVEKGLSEAGAAGIAGNLFVESGFKTYVLGDHGTSNGLAQWHNERWTGPDGFEAWCTSHGMDPWSVEGQLEFLWWELTTNYTALVTFLQDTGVTPYDAAYEFADKFERPSSISPVRMSKAEEFYEDYTSFV